MDAVNSFSDVSSVLSSVFLVVVVDVVVVVLLSY